MTLKEIRQIKGLTREEVAKKLSISVHTLKAIETGKRKPGHFLSLKIAELYGISIKDVR